jgi:hypothetical protein
VLPHAAATEHKLAIIVMPVCDEYSVVAARAVPPIRADTASVPVRTLLAHIWIFRAG